MHSAIFYSSCFAFFFVFYSLSLMHHPHWFLTSVWKSLLWVSAAEFVSDPLGKTVTAWIWCQSHLVLLVTKIIPRPMPTSLHPRPLPAPRPALPWSALGHGPCWPRQMVAWGCTQPGHWPLGPHPCQGRGRNHSFSFRPQGSKAQRLRARAQKPGCQRCRLQLCCWRPGLR